MKTNGAISWSFRAEQVGGVGSGLRQYNSNVCNGAPPFVLPNDAHPSQARSLFHPPTIRLEPELLAVLGLCQTSLWRSTARPRPHDEKWFWQVVVLHRNLKRVPFFGIEPVKHGVQHKSHIDKTMGIASTTFIPKGNDMTAGSVLCALTGRKVKADRNSYKRVYCDDGSYHYPKIPEDILRKKGQE
jgi:hypothetical protein